jgi:capsular polysaccharide biosynthesis protein
VIPRHPSGLPSWAIELLELFFEKSLTDRILFIDEGQCASFKNILFPSTCFRTHQAVHPITRDLCRKVGQIARNLSSQDPKEAIFLSRAHIGNRKCRNEEAVENAFVAKGYHVVIPEKLTAIDQLALAATSKKIAGFTGSANYLALFSAGLSEFTVCAPRDFFLIDEYMISSLQACELNVVFGTTREGDLHVNNGSWELNLDELKSVS